MMVAVAPAVVCAGRRAGAPGFAAATRLTPIQAVLRCSIAMLIGRGPVRLARSERRFIYHR